MQVYGSPIMKATDVEVGTVMVEGHNGVRYRVTAIDVNPHSWAYNVLHLTPIDNPLPVPRGNAPGRRPIRLALSHVVGSPEDMLEPEWTPSRAWRMLRDHKLIEMDTAAYARAIGAGAEGIEWVPWTEA